MMEVASTRSPRPWHAGRAFSAWARPLFAARPAAEEVSGIPRNRLQLLDLVVFLLYAVLLAFALHFHVYSDDESQAWLLVRDNSLSQLLLRRLHYEGAPALWPLILWVATRLNVPFAGMRWIGGAFALTGIAVFLRFAPFPRIFRWLLPFTFFLQFQYGAIARPYTLFPLLLFTLCVLYPLRRPRPILFAVAAGVMANLSFHAAVIAGLFGILYLRSLLRAQDDPCPRKPAPREITIAIGVFSVLALLASFTAFPPPDSAFPPKDAATSASAAATPPSRWKRLVSTVFSPETLPPGAPPLDPILVTDAQKAAFASRPSPIVFLIVRTALLAADTALYPISSSNLLGILFLFAFVRWLKSRQHLELLLPYVLSILIACQIFVYDHHSGQFLLTLLAAAWIALELPAPTPASPAPSSPLASLTANRLFASIALVVILLQIAWSVHAIRAQVTQPYDPGRETAEFLQHHFAGKRIAGFSYESVPAQAYAKHNLFLNQPAAWWLWSSSVFIDRRKTEALNLHPDVVVLAETTPGPEFFYNQVSLAPAAKTIPSSVLPFFLDHGFHETHRFCGYRFIRLSYSQLSCEVILEPNPHTSVGP